MSASTVPIIRTLGYIHVDMLLRFGSPQGESLSDGWACSRKHRRISAGEEDEGRGKGEAVGGCRDWLPETVGGQRRGQSCHSHAICLRRWPDVAPTPFSRSLLWVDGRRARGASSHDETTFPVTFAFRERRRNWTSRNWQRPQDVT